MNHKFKIGDRVICTGTSAGRKTGEWATIESLSEDQNELFVDVRFDNGEEIYGLYAWRFYYPSKLHKALL